MSVYIENETADELPENYRDIVLDVTAAALDFIKCPYECELNVIFTDNAGIQEINSQYRDIDSPTDVLSFPLIEYESPGVFEGIPEDSADYFNQDTGELMLGDIVLNVDRIISQAADYGHTRKRELAFLTAHSMLHLFGYDHMEEDERIAMERLQEEILNMKGYTRENEEE
jgi:probable rRNA maturation factor